MWSPFKKPRLIPPGKSLQPDKIFKSGDAWLSSVDVIEASLCFSSDALPDQGFGRSLVVLNHLLTTVVLSDRVAYVYDLETDDDDPLDHVSRQLIRHCRPVVIDQHHDYVRPILTADASYFESVLSTDIVNAIYDSYRELRNEQNKVFDYVFLADYACASRSRALYAPNPLLAARLARVAAHRISQSLAAEGAESILMSTVDELRREAASQYNQLRGAALVDLHIPALFGVILRESRDSEDLFRITRQINSEARDFREWCRQLNESPDPLQFLQKIGDAKDALHRLGKVIDARRETRLQISIIPGIATAQLPFQLSSQLEREARKAEIPLDARGPITFLSHLLAAARQVQHFDQELSRVFGLPIAKARTISELMERYAAAASRDTPALPPSES